MNKLAVWVFLYLLCTYPGHTQCGEETYELALAQAGKDIVLVRDFKVKLREGNKKNPIPSSRFSVLMQKGLTYRFNITKDKETIAEPLIQLFDRNELLGSTFDRKTSKYLQKFEYLCARTGNYQVIVSMKDGEAGCAVGLMSMVIDSAFFQQGNTVPENDRYILYAGVENPLHIYTDQKNIKRTEITIDQGQIIMRDSLYYALIPTTGQVKIKVQLFNNADTIVEQHEQEFKVVPVPRPTITIEGAYNEYLNSYNITSVLKLTIKPSIYTIQEFYLSSELGANQGYRSDNEYFTHEMIEYLKTLDSMQRFFINTVKVAGPAGKIEYLGPFTFYIR